jgi:hypothetical protein
VVLLAGAPVKRTPAAKSPWLAAGTGELARPLFASAGFVHSQGASLNFFAVKGVDGGRGRGGVAHRHEREAAGAASDAIIDERHFRDGAVLFEKILEIVFGRIEGKISYVEFHVFEFWSNSLPATSRSRESGFKSPKSETQLTIYQAKKQNRLNPMAGTVAQKRAKHKEEFARSVDSHFEAFYLQSFLAKRNLRERKVGGLLPLFWGEQPPFALLRSVEGGTFFWRPL